MAKLTIEIKDADAETIANHAERIAEMLRDGYTSGDASDEDAGRGWWNVEDLAEHTDDA